ncbi:MAG: 8-amino-7-oxononanoate synthase [Sporomusaceae bacterium]|nr:8-amino-7-oxononanoate synthase [Sporomusaceae bacterium]
MKKFDEMAAQLAALDDNKLRRRLVDFEPVTPARVRKDGKEYILFSSNNYLGLTHHETVMSQTREAVAYGTGSGGARLTSGNHSGYRLVEAKLAQFKETEAALIFNTGYMANLGIVSAMVGEQDIVFSDALNHASIIDGCRLAKGKTVVYRHSDMDHLAELLAVTPCAGQRFIVTDGVFSMDGDIAKLPEIVALGEQYDALLMVDDAHATGVIGPGGKGTSAHFGLKGRIHLEVGTLSKSLAAEGGFVAGKTLLIDYLMNRSRSFIFSTALAPQTLAAAAAALDVLVAEPEIVQILAAKSEYFKSLLQSYKVPIMMSETAIIPILIGDAANTMEAAKRLEAAGLLVSAIRPPTVPQGSSRLRLTVTAAHSKDDLTVAAQKIGQVLQDMKLLTTDL